jgi:hypothetical protein
MTLYRQATTFPTSNASEHLEAVLRKHIYKHSTGTVQTYMFAR